MAANKLSNSILDFSLNVAIVVSLAILIRIFLIEPFNVEGSSMCDTLNFVDGKCVHHSERILVNKITYGGIGSMRFGAPERGDIVVFTPPQGRDESYIKRIIGVPGDTIELKDGEVILYNENQPEGKTLDEEYLNKKNKGKTFAIGGVKKFTVPEGSYFVMGDNRAASTDSRACFQLNAQCKPGDNHFVPLELIRGKAWITIWPLTKIRAL